MFGLTAVNHCIDRIDTNVAFADVRWNAIVSPFAEMPEMWADLPARNASPPTMSFCRSRLTPSGEPIFGLRIRSHERWYAAAVTGDPSENFSPGRMWNTYVFPLLVTVGNDVAATG